MRLLVGYISGVMKRWLFSQTGKKNFSEKLQQDHTILPFLLSGRVIFFLNIILYAFVVLHLEIVTFSRQGIYDTRLLLLKYSNFSFDCMFYDHMACAYFPAIREGH